MGLDQHFFKTPLPDPLPPKWSTAAEEWDGELLYLRKAYAVHRALEDVLGITIEDDGRVPVIVTREQVEAVRGLVAEADEYAWDMLTRLLHEHRGPYAYLAHG